MQACRDDHEHHHGGQDHSHDHDHEHEHEVEDAEGDSLFRYIDTSKVRALNALDPQHATHPFKPFHSRTDHSTWLSSQDDDPELIIYIPYAYVYVHFCRAGADGWPS